LFFTEGVKNIEKKRKKQDEIWSIDKEIERVNSFNNSGLQVQKMQENKSIIIIYIHN